MRIAPLLLAALTGCGIDETPTHAADMLWLEPGEPVTGFVTWSIHGPGWERTRAERHYLCAVVFDLELEASAPEGCPACTHRFAVTGSDLVETDCADELSLPAITGVALGPISTELDGAEPWPQVRAGSYVSYDGGSLVPHGWAFPGAEPAGAVDALVWDESSPVTAWPAFTVDLIEAD